MEKTSIKKIIIYYFRMKKLIKSNTYELLKEKINTKSIK